MKAARSSPVGGSGLHATVFLLGAFGGAANAVTCDMSGDIKHIDPRKTTIFTASAGKPSIFFTADLDVNTDGSARSYHPDDPRGQSRALNNIANAITAIHDQNGNNIGCNPRRGECFTRYIQTFEAARDSGWKTESAPRVKTDGIIPWSKSPSGALQPCTISEGEFKGFFVSQTAMLADPNRGTCDQRRYLDSLSFSAVVIPKGVSWSSLGRKIRNGDLAVVQNAKTKSVEYAVVGDRGPADSIGEGTVYLAAKLSGKSLSGSETYDSIKKLAIPKVHYLILPGQNIRSAVGPKAPLTQADIDRVGAQEFRAWGGEDRLAACGG